MNRAFFASLIVAAAGVTWLLFHQDGTVHPPIALRPTEAAPGATAREPGRIAETDLTNLVEWLDPLVVGEPVVV